MAAALILGGIKSGKSRLAEKLAKESNMAVTYIATAQANDSEMLTRITQHQQQRPTHWLTVETPIKLGEKITEYNQQNQCVLVDCLTMWLTNLLMLNDEKQLETEIDKFVLALNQFSGRLILVSNETNMGIIPLGELTRQYCDRIGKLHQQIATQVDTVVLTVAGLPHVLKGSL
jgi:adenosylcobinamide kinase/adenosylcobinamide-phosphate guanylyltransferase